MVTPARVDKGNLTRKDMVLVRDDGTVEGLHPASSEFPFHQAIYRARPDLQAIVHAHPVALVAFSICHQMPNTRLFHQAFSVCGNVGFAPYALPGSSALGANIAHKFREGCDSVILENHGVVVGGQSLTQAFQRFEALEFAGKTVIKASHLGPIHYLDDGQLRQAQERSSYTRTFAPGVCIGGGARIASAANRICASWLPSKLLISTEGSFSARVDDSSFLITPSQRDRERLRIDDFVLVRGEACEEGKLPSRATPLHRAIYDLHPEMRAIVFRPSSERHRFSITDACFDARTIPESYVFLRDVQRLRMEFNTGATDHWPRPCPPLNRQPSCK